MEFTGQFTTQTSTETAAKKLTDIRCISQCLPTLSKLEIVNDEEFLATFKVDLTDAASKIHLDYLSRLTVRMHFKYLEKTIDTIVLEGTGRTAGSKLTLTLRLSISEGKDGSIIAWKAEAEFGRFLKLFGEKLVRDVSGGIISDLTECLSVKLASA